MSGPGSGVGASGSGGSQPTALSSDNAVILAECVEMMPDANPAAGTVAAAGKNIMDLQAQVQHGLTFSSLTAESNCKHRVLQSWD